MKRLDPHGWYVQLEERRQLDRADSDPRDPDDPKLRRVTDPKERDRLMCRTDVVAVCNTPEDLEVARFNGRLVLEIDPHCPDETLFEKIATELNRTRKKKPHRMNTRA
jgi:hypothetical protein